MDLNQVTLPVTDFETAYQFYGQIGLKPIVYSQGRYARFELPSGSSTLSLHVADHAMSLGVVIYFECDDVDARYEALRAKGVEFLNAPRDEVWGWREARFKDPSGNELCLFHAGQNRRFPAWRLPSAGDL